jgi:Cyclic nucleotide-binding domain
VVYEPHERLDHAYFPTSCVVSLVYATEDGHTAEIGLVGHEGVVGIAVFMGGETRPIQAVVQVAGGALRLPAAALQAEFRNGGPF